MPTVLNADGLRVVIYHNDHAPSHVHVVGPGWVAVVDLADLGLRAFRGTERDAARARRVVAEHRAVLLAEWERLHG